MKNNILSTSLMGGFYLLLLFICCFLVVSAVKIIYMYFRKEKPDNKTFIYNTPQKIHRAPRQIKSITINPEEISRIYVKKN